MNRDLRMNILEVILSYKCTILNSAKGKVSFYLHIPHFLFSITQHKYALDLIPAGIGQPSSYKQIQGAW